MLFLFHALVVAVVACVFGAQLKVVGIEFAYMQIEFEFGFANFIQDIFTLAFSIVFFWSFINSFDWANVIL